MPFVSGMLCIPLTNGEGKTSMTPPALVYLGMGLIVARIMLDGIQTRGYTWLKWVQYLFNAARITLLWPLVLLIDKFETWLKAGSVLAEKPASSPETQKVEPTSMQPSSAGEKP